MDVTAFSIINTRLCFDFKYKQARVEHR